MAIDLIVLAVSLLMAGFFGVWLFFPRLRPWMEAPKYRMLQWPNRCLDAVRPERKAGDGKKPTKEIQCQNSTAETF